ncbi:hypothetical protein [Lysinibacillus xylanilyticus]|uniref:Uncharacterized protein n=1 Tax=Lysinibacillus xylanilyticus TaxID=582475 RepID=A0ABT4EME8_9BACI|nr:hypothetical protein [Lysinibacillus xylanilyticus]MCY9546817.1 hypothetical protein [Lysinibacillus xylanilyticus]
MTNFTTGADALAALNSNNESSKNREFTSIKSGSKFIVRVIDKAAVQMAYSYGIFKQVNSFVAKEPSIKTPNGFPTDNLTPWDKAYKYHKDKSKDFNDEHGQEASKYRAKQRFAMAFFDLDKGEYIIVDLSKKQAQSIATVISKNESKLGKKAFELEKVGSGTSTSVMLSPLDLEDLTEKQRANFDKAPTEFDQTVFNGIWYEQNEAQMIELLKQAGFNISLVGYNNVVSTLNGDVDDEPLPF